MQQARAVVSHILARSLCSQTGYPALIASRTERLHSSMSRTWKTSKPSMGIFRPLCKAADGSRGDGVGLIITSSRPPMTTTTPSPPPVRTGRSSTISPGHCLGDIFVIIALQGNDAALSVHLFSHCVSARTSHFLCKRAPHIQARGKIKIRSPLQMRRWFLVLYNREEKAGGLAEMQALVLVVLAVITQKKIRPGCGTLF